MGEIVGRQRLAAFLGFSERSITEWTRAGMPVHRVGGRGKENEYDTAEVVPWLLSRETSSGDPETIAARRRIACAEAGRREIRLARERGEVADLRLVGMTWERAIGVFRNRMLGLPRRAVPRLRGVPADTKREKLLTELVHEALNELAETNFGGIIHEAAVELGYKAPPPAESKTVPLATKKHGNGKEKS